MTRGSARRAYCKLFSDVRHGNEQAALIAAQAWRDAIEQMHPKQTRRDLSMRQVKNNTSGRTGVHRIVKPRKRGEPAIYWEAITPSWVAPRRRCSFSVGQYGDEEAFRLAVAARQAFELETADDAAAHAPISPGTGRKHAPELRGIYRLEKTHFGVWQVRIIRQSPSRIFRKRFPDPRYGGSAQALAAAQRWRDEIERQHPKLSKKQRANALNARNTSGKSGVIRQARLCRHTDGSASVINYWQAKTPGGIKPTRTRTFSTERHGEREAYRLAVEARLAFEAMLDEPSR
jgi:hypothetical protein